MKYWYAEANRTRVRWCHNLPHGTRNVSAETPVCVSKSMPRPDDFYVYYIYAEDADAAKAMVLAFINSVAIQNT